MNEDYTQYLARKIRQYDAELANPAINAGTACAVAVMRDIYQQTLDSYGKRASPWCHTNPLKIHEYPAPDILAFSDEVHAFHARGGEVL